jgi:outer membrane lipoprotein
MPSARLYRWLGISGVCLCLLGCASTIPAPMAASVAWDVRFRELRRQPEAYKGRIVALGGIVSQIDAVAEGFRLTVSEIPLNGSGRQRPAVNQPPGGFFVVQMDAERLPKDLRPGAEITIVGEVLGSYPPLRNEQAPAVPLLAGRYLQVWGSSWWPRIQIGIGGTITP